MPIVGAPSTTAELILDPVSEDAGNVELEVGAGTNYLFRAHAYPTPAAAFQWASSVSTEGARLSSKRHENRTITFTVEATGLGALYDLEAKIGKLYREGGTLKRVYSDGREIVFDVLTVSNYEATFEELHHFGGLTPVTVALECKPYGRGAEETLTSHSETTLPVLVFTETAITGDMPAEGRLVVTEAQAKDQWWLTWGIQSRYYDSATSAALFYEAEGRTLMGGSTIVTGTAPASGGASNNVVRASLTGSDQAILSTQATGGGTHLTHVGGFRVYARVRPTTTSAGDITLALQWGIGDFNRPTTNAAVSIPAAKAGTVYYLADLGTVSIPEVTQGAQRWEGRIVGRSTVAGNLLDIDHLFFVPTDEGWGVASGVERTFTPSSFSARDEFDQTAGALAAKILPVGGTWTGTGDADDFSVTGSGALQRTAVSDADVNTGRYAIAGTATATDVAVALDVDPFPFGIGWSFNRCVLARYTDANNWLHGGITQAGAGGPGLAVRKRVAGTVTTLKSLTPPPAVLQNITWSVVLIARASGSWQLLVNGAVMLSGYDADLATGGALASGKVGIYESFTGSTAATRVYDNFWTAAPSADAAVFASQSLEIGPGNATREDLSGAIWTRPGRYEGDYLRIPPAGQEARTARFIIKATRLEPFDSGDLAIDDISAQVIYTPRYLVVPEL